MQAVEAIFNTFLMVVVFLISMASMLFGLSSMNEATAGVGFVCVGIYCLVVVRLMQASVANAKMLKAIEKSSEGKPGLGAG